MARLPRLLLPDLPHHLVQRGHNSQPIVVDDQDRQCWRELLRDATVTHHVSLHAWSLLDTEFHLVATPSSAQGLSRMMQSLTRRHAAEFNRRHGRRGTLWEGRFRASLTEPGSSLLDLMQLVETMAPAPEVADLEPASVLTSSLGHHLGHQRDPVITEPPAWWGLGNTPFEREAAWRERAVRGVPADVARRLEAALQRGRPAGSPAFLARLATDWPVFASPRPRGRPRKATPSAAVPLSACETAAGKRPR